MTQKDAVFNAVTSVLANNNITFASGSNVADLLTRELRSQINTQLMSDFQAGNVALAADSQSKLTNTVELRNYVSGLVSNWVRKDPRLNGGTVVATTSSSSTKSLNSDPKLRALRKLHATQTDLNRKAEIQGYIDARLEELSK